MSIQSFKDLLDIINEKYESEDRKKNDKATNLSALYKIRQDKFAIGEDLTVISEMIDKTMEDLKNMN